MTSDGWQRAWSTLPARPEPEPPWEPDEAALRRKARQDSLSALGVAAVLWALQVLLPDHAGVPYVVGWSVATGINLARMNAAQWRGRYRRQIRDQLRVDHALRAHVSIGRGDREHVSSCARWRRWRIPVLRVAGPLVAGLLTWAATAAERPTVWLVLLAVLAAAYCHGLVVWPQQLRDARRWLADPLPREDR